MKRLICLWLLVLGAVGWAQEAKVSSTPVAESSPEIAQPEVALDPAEEEFALLTQHMVDAFNAHEVDSMLEGVTEDVVVTLHDGTVLKGRESIRSVLKKALKGPQPSLTSVRITPNLEQLLVLYSRGVDDLGAPFGLAYGRSKDEFLLADRTRLKLDANWTVALVRDEQSWKVASLHYSVDMNDNPALADSQKKLLTYGLMGIFLGAGIGFLIGRRRT